MSLISLTSSKHTTFTKASPFLLIFSLNNLSHRENSPLVHLHYDQSTIETKEEDLEDPANYTQESAFYVRNRKTSVGKSYLHDTPGRNKPKMKSGKKERKVHVLESFNKDLGEIKYERNGKKMMRSVRCNCRKSQCKKNYCDCLAEGRFCGENCCCKDCKNLPGMKEESGKKRKREILEEDSCSEERGRELKGCNCKRSKCEKKYCDCFSMGMKCGEGCCCVNCRNKPVKVEGTPKKMLKLLSADEKRTSVVERKERMFSSVRKITDWNQHTLSIYDSGVNFGLKLFTDHIEPEPEAEELL